MMDRAGSEHFSEDIWRRLEPWGRRLDEEIARLEPELIRVRRHLHAHPEPSGEEIETSQFVRERFQKAGIDAWIARSDVGNRVGVVADLTVGKPAETSSPNLAMESGVLEFR